MEAQIGFMEAKSKPTTQKPDEYLSYERIKELHNPKGDVEVKCYTNGLWWVCPNPKDPERAKGVEYSYRKGLFISFKMIRLSQKDFDNEDNWNS